jgi:hypothetical protein
MGGSGTHIATVYRQGLAGDEIAVRRREEHQGAQQILGMLVAPQRP